MAASALAVALAVALAGCHQTTDSLGYQGAGGLMLHPLHGPASYPNALRDLAMCRSSFPKKKCAASTTTLRRVKRVESASSMRNKL